MRIFHRTVMLVALGAFGFALSACTDFDPDKLDVFHLNEKKKLPGDRKELFPGGVPGVTQGIPPEYMKGFQEPSDPAAQTPLPGETNSAAAATAESAKKTAAVEPEPESKPKPKPKRKPKPQPVQQQQQAPQQASGQQQAPAWPQQNPQPAPQQAQSPWPAPQEQANAPAPWPSAPQPGTFSR